MDRDRRILVASETGISIRFAKDITDAIAACMGADGIILAEDDLAPEFFELRTELAGELFQKFMNYRVRVAFILPNTAAHGKRFSELAYEHSSHDIFVLFVPGMMRWLGSYLNCVYQRIVQEGRA
jgi:hypothetical protein